MKFPDRPALNVILGVVCALVVLAVLSSPLAGSQSSPLVANRNAASVNSNVGSYGSSSSATAPLTSLSLTSSSSTSFLVSSTAAAQQLQSSNSSESMSVSGSKNSQVPTNSSADAIAPALSSVTTLIGTANALPNAQTNTTVISMATSAVPEQTTVGSVSIALSSSTKPSAPNFGPALGNNVESRTFQIFGIISITSVVIAAGSMLLVYRRVSREDSSEK